MPKFTNKELELIDKASRGLIQTVKSSKFIKSALEMSYIRPIAIDKAIEAAIYSASRISPEAANKRWEIVVVLCSLNWSKHKPSKGLVEKVFIHVINEAAKTNNWEFVIALCNLAAPAHQPRKEIINMALETALSVAESYEEKGMINLSSIAWDAVKAIARIQDPATMPDKKLSENALEQLAKVPQKRVDKKFEALTLEREWVKVLNYFVQNHQGKPSHKSINFALITAASDGQWEVFKSLSSFQQPDKKTAGEVLQIAARKGTLEIVRLLCNLDEQNATNIHYVTNAISIANNTGNLEIASYLSCEKIRQTSSNKDPLFLTQIILQDFVHHTLTISSLFSGQTKAIKKILSQVKCAAEKETSEDARKQMIVYAVDALKAIKGSNKELNAYINYIDCHCSKTPGDLSLDYALKGLH
ncbi:TPA: hypothetical protein SJ233_002907 [Legionella pneumophila]|jgi:hypothetical protein|nr:hypothetical protein [Legionella pneumophila]